MLSIDLVRGPFKFGGLILGEMVSIMISCKLGLGLNLQPQELLKEKELSEPY